MSNPGTNDQSAADTPGVSELSPAALADRVAAMAGRELQLDASSLPIWDRADARPPRVWARRLLLIAGWGITLALAVVAMLRIVCHDAATALVWLNAFTLYVYLPAYVVLAVAARKRRWYLAAASGVVVVCHLAWVAPDFRPATPYPTSPAAAGATASRPVRIFYANVHTWNSDYAGILTEIADADPDAVVLMEVGFKWYEFVRESPLLKPYAYGTNLSGPYNGEIVVLSRLPVSRQQTIWYTGRMNSVVDIRLQNEVLRLFCLHGPRPLNESQPEYFAFWQKLEAILPEQPEPLLLIGDFNATQHSLVHERLTGARLRSAHVDRGRGYATTWPNGLVSAPPIRIDHALVSPQVECLSIREGRGAGSDHKPLILDVRVHRVELPSR